MTTINTMVKRIGGLADTTDVTDWENKFIKDMVRITRDGEDTRMLNGNQIEKVQQIHDKYFTG